MTELYSTLNVTTTPPAMAALDFSANSSYLTGHECDVELALKEATRAALAARSTNPQRFVAYTLLGKTEVHDIPTVDDESKFDRDLALQQLGSALKAAVVEASKRRSGHPEEVIANHLLHLERLQVKPEDVEVPHEISTRGVRIAIDSARAARSRSQSFEGSRVRQGAQQRESARQRQPFNREKLDLGGGDAIEGPGLGPQTARWQAAKFSYRRPHSARQPPVTFSYPGAPARTPNVSVGFGRSSSDGMRKSDQALSRSSTGSYRARPVPSSTLEPRLDKMIEEELARKKRISQEAERLLGQSRLPPRMAQMERQRMQSMSSLSHWNREDLYSTQGLSQSWAAAKPSVRPRSAGARRPARDSASLSTPTQRGVRVEAPGTDPTILGNRRDEDVPIENMTKAELVAVLQQRSWRLPDAATCDRAFFIELCTHFGLTNVPSKEVYDARKAIVERDMLMLVGASDDEADVHTETGTETHTETQPATPPATQADEARDSASSSAAFA